MARPPNKLSSIIMQENFTTNTKDVFIFESQRVNS